MSEFEVEGVRPPTEAEQALSAWFAQQRLGSVEALENAAKLIVGLISGILTLLLGVLALSNEPGKLPIYTLWPWVRVVAGLGVLAQLVSLGAGLVVVMPRARGSNPNQPSSEQDVFKSIVKQKSLCLTICLWSFGIGMALIGAVLIGALASIPSVAPTGPGATATATSTPTLNATATPTSTATLVPTVPLPTAVLTSTTTSP